jgi:hypothetical protein
MDMYCNELQIEATPAESYSPAVPMASEADFDQVFGYLPQIGLFTTADSDSYAYFNADTCPECGSGMIRQGRCCACPSCGFETCMVR